MSKEAFQLLLGYLLLVNLIAFVLMGLDKCRARRDRWRIPEKTLFLPAVLGGSAGGGRGDAPVSSQDEALVFSLWTARPSGASDRAGGRPLAVAASLKRGEEKGNRFPCIFRIFWYTIPYYPVSCRDFSP